MKFDGEPTRENLLKYFIYYMAEWKRLNRLYHLVPKIPIYRIVKQNQILNQQGRLSESYRQWLKKYEDNKARISKGQKANGDKKERTRSNSVEGPKGRN